MNDEEMVDLKCLLFTQELNSELQTMNQFFCCFLEKVRSGLELKFFARTTQSTTSKNEQNFWRVRSTTRVIEGSDYQCCWQVL